MRPNRRRIQITRSWPHGEWRELVLRFHCGKCGQGSGTPCRTPSGNEAHTHKARYEAATKAVLNAVDSGKDPKAVGLR